MRDWKAAYGAPPAGFEEAIARALREKEEKKMIHGKRRWTILLIAALITALLAGMAYAAVESGLLDALRGDGLTPAADAADIIKRDLGSATVNGVTMTVTEAAYTGRTLNLIIEFVGNSEESETPKVTITAREVELGSTYCVDETRSGLQSQWVTVLLDDGAPEQLNLTVTSPIGHEISFALNKTAADEVSLISEKTVSDDGTLTVYDLKLSRSPLSQVVFVRFACTLPAFEFALAFLDADGNALDCDNAIISSETLPDGTEGYVQESILGRDERIAAVCVYEEPSGTPSGAVWISSN